MLYVFPFELIVGTLWRPFLEMRMLSHRPWYKGMFTGHRDPWECSSLWNQPYRINISIPTKPPITIYHQSTTLTMDAAETFCACSIINKRTSALPLVEKVNLLLVEDK